MSEYIVKGQLNSTFRKRTYPNHYSNVPSAEMYGIPHAISPAQWFLAPLVKGPCL